MAKHVIWHLGQWNNNYGSMSIQQAFRKNLSQRTSDELEFVYLDIDNVIFSKDLISKMNNEADLLLIGSGAMIINRPNTITGWQLNLEHGALEGINIPVAVYAIDSEILSNENRLDMSKIDSYVGALSDKASFFSFRTPDTADTFEHIIEDALVSPDISMFSNQGVTISNTALNTDKLKIGFNWPTDSWDKRFESHFNGGKYLESALRALSNIIEVYNAKVFLIEHSQSSISNFDGKRILRENAQYILGDNVCFVFDELSEFWPPQEIYADFFRGIYNKMDFVISGRAISAIEAFSQNIPFVCLGPNNKIKRIASYMVGLEYYVDLKKVNAEGLEQKIVGSISSSTSIKDYLSSQKSIFEAVKNTHLDAIIGLL